MSTLSNPSLREPNFIKAQLADKAGRHDHSVRFMIEISKSVTPSAELSPSERNFFVNSLKKFLDDHRQAWHKISSETFKWVGVQSQVARSYSKRIAEEILNVCREIELLINGHLILSAQSAESRVFYLTFKGDVKAYMAGMMKGKERDSEEVAAILAYQQAKAIAKAELTWLSPARLTLALRMSEFYIEVIEFPDLGARIARKALKKATKAGPNLTEGEIAKEINEVLSKLSEYIDMVTNKDGQAEAGTSTFPTQLVAGTSLAQQASPSETDEKARTSRPKPAAEEAETSMTTLTPPTESGDKIRTSETFSMPPSSPGESPPLTSPLPPPPLPPPSKGKRKIDDV